MRYIVDISPDIVDIIQDRINKGEYRTVQEFITTSLQNQIYLTEHPIDSYNQILKTDRSLLKGSEAISTEDLLKLNLISISTVDPDPNRLPNNLSGFWNKIFPVKITVRILSNLIENEKGPVLLDSLQEVASREARKIGLSLMRSEKGSGRKRGDRLFTGLPVSENSESSKSRIKSHFVGEIRSNKIDGMPGTLRLLDIKIANDGKEYVSLTHLGLKFSNIENPYIDHGDKNSILSSEEKEFVINIIKNHLPEEYKEIIYLLKLINEGKTNTKDLVDSVAKVKQDYNENQIHTYLTGQLNRMTDLDLVNRKYDGLSYIYKISEKGKTITESAGDK
ncbi:MAG: hypothetical protein ACTSQY_06435 [Candidatus Odinarchaeia archaeon]